MYSNYVFNSMTFYVIDLHNLHFLDSQQLSNKLEQFLIDFRIEFQYLHNFF